MPDAYTQTHVNRWLSLEDAHPNITFDGTMTECNLAADPLPTTSCNVDEDGDGVSDRTENAPNRAWTQVWIGAGQGTLNYSTNIRYQP